MTWITTDLHALADDTFGPCHRLGCPNAAQTSPLVAESVQSSLGVSLPPQAGGVAELEFDRWAEPNA